ncbi:hypothetical protein EYF80_029759 [Liparis tanakae]|uniref:Uncharacterized protein n=1 Tax=Liparis tanakae TaxID=230148 RepID=A0A4Z2H323_9TELE|nr:hypothetical protein EYF80_029759 [Liparis tanakae]
MYYEEISRAMTRGIRHSQRSILDWPGGRTELLYAERRRCLEMLQFQQEIETCSKAGMRTKIDKLLGRMCRQPETKAGRMWL